MKNLLLLLIYIFSFCSFTTAQVAVGKTVAEEDMEHDTFGYTNYFQYKKTNLIGKENFFINKDWYRSKVFDKDGNETILHEANYLIGERLILFKKKDELFQIYPHAVSLFVINNTMFKAYPSVNKENEDILEFYEVPAAGYLEIVKVWNTKESVFTNNPMGIQDSNKVEITKTSKLYYKKGKQRRLKNLPKKKDNRYAIFGGKRKKVMAYAKEHNLSIKKEADLVTLITYYNSQESMEGKD